MPTCRRDALLRRCLRALMRQEVSGEFEVIVVDDARSPATPRTVREVRRESGGQVYALPGRGKGPAAARNTGWLAARGDIIAFIDDDAYPADSRWLAAALSAFDKDSRLDGLSGAVRVPASDPPTDFQRNVKKLEESEFATCNAFYRRSALARVGGFDERFEAPFREDSDLRFRIEEAGGLLVKADEPAVIHPAPRGPFGVSLRLQRYSMYNALIFKKHRRRFRESLQRWPPVHYYAMVLLLAGAAFGFALGQAGVGVALFAGWTLLEAAFFARRIRGTSLAPRDVLDMAVTSLLIPPLAVYWRLRGALRYRVLFI